MSKVYGKHLRMEVIASQVSDTCSETFVAVTSSAERSTLFAFCLEAVGNNFLNNIILDCSFMLFYCI